MSEAERDKIKLFPKRASELGPSALVGAFLCPTFYVESSRRAGRLLGSARQRAARRASIIIPYTFVILYIVLFFLSSSSSLQIFASALLVFFFDCSDFFSGFKIFVPPPFPLLKSIRLSFFSGQPSSLPPFISLYVRRSLFDRLPCLLLVSLFACPSSCCQPTNEYMEMWRYNLKRR